MEIKKLLKEGRAIWGKRKMPLSQIIAVLGVVHGDICRWQRNAGKDAKHHTEKELKKELGNVIFSTIRWCDDLEFDPEECVALAVQAQKKFKK